MRSTPPGGVRSLLACASAYAARWGGDFSAPGQLLRCENWRVCTPRYVAPRDCGNDSLRNRITHTVAESNFKIGSVRQAVRDCGPHGAAQRERARSSRCEEFGNGGDCELSSRKQMAVYALPPRHAECCDGLPRDHPGSEPDAKLLRRPLLQLKTLYRAGGDTPRAGPPR